jgi:hypothetical protein
MAVKIKPVDQPNNLKMKQLLPALILIALAACNGRKAATANPEKKNPAPSAYHFGGEDPYTGRDTSVQKKIDSVCHARGHAFIETETRFVTAAELEANMAAGETVIDTPDSTYVVMHPAPEWKFCGRCCRIIPLPRKDKWLRTVWKKSN